MENNEIMQSVLDDVILMKYVGYESRPGAWRWQADNEDLWKRKISMSSL